MINIRKKLNRVFIVSSIITIFLVTLFINLTINKSFKEYMDNVQNERYERIVNYFQEIYNKYGEFYKDSGDELIHEAYMNDYYLTLMDKNKNVIWGMNPNDMKDDLHFKHRNDNDGEIYSSKIFEIKSNEQNVGYVEIGQYSPILLSEEDMNFIVSINRSIVISTIITLMIGILISFYLSKQFSKPISEVSKAYVKLSRGNFDINIESNSEIQEINNLKSSINILAEKLKYQDKIRKVLISDISHEIRTPLNILQNNLEAMIDGVFPITNDSLITLNEEVIRFGKLLNNLELLKKFEFESVKFNLQRIDLEDLIIQIYEEFKVIAKSKQIKIYCNIENNKDYFIIGDVDKIKQVFINLLNNALKFTEDNGYIYIYLSKVNNEIIVEIEDTGIGISKNDLPYIFRRLYRSDVARNTIEGTGIGLAIVKNILECHNANISVESEIGKGSIFKVIFYNEKN